MNLGAAILQSTLKDLVDSKKEIEQLFDICLNVKSSKSP
jgi:hypothetical protein